MNTRACYISKRLDKSYINLTVCCRKPCMITEYSGKLVNANTFIFALPGEWAVSCAEADIERRTMLRAQFMDAAFLLQDVRKSDLTKVRAT